MKNPRDPSRRDFLAASAVGLVELARGSESLAWSEESQLDGLLYAAGLTASISSAWTSAPGDCG